jgi:hypothetical protein
MRGGKSPRGVDIFQAKEYDAAHKEVKSARPRALAVRQARTKLKGRSVSDDKEIRDAIERERHPERKYTKAELRALESELRKIRQFGDEREFMQFLRGIGLSDESSRFVEAVKLYRSLKREKP